MKLETVQTDERGGIYSITGEEIESPEYAILKSKKNMARGGCIHANHSENLVVLEGRILYFSSLTPNGVLLTKGDSYFLPPNVPHYYISLTDSIVMEWGCPPEEKKVKHKEYRAIVESHNASLKS